MAAAHGHRRWLAAALLLLFFTTALAGGARVSASGGMEEWADPPAVSAEERRRLAVGPGSSPPTCRSRCGGCLPCRAVHVAIQPGRLSFPLEYYPEAWRCKCGDKLFMP